MSKINSSKIDLVASLANVLWQMTEVISWKLQGDFKELLKVLYDYDLNEKNNVQKQKQINKVHCKRK